MRAWKSLQVFILVGVLVFVAMVLPGTALAASGGPDAFGYTYTDDIPFNFEEFRDTPLALSDDQMSGAIPLGFTFNYYGVNYTEVYVSSNGFLTVLPGQYNGCCTGAPFPTAGDPDGVIAGLWADLNPGAGGVVHYTTLGTAPNRRFIVSYEGVPFWGTDTTTTFQIKLFEGSNNIEVHYYPGFIDNYWGLSTAGIENQDGTIGLTYFAVDEVQIGSASTTRMGKVHAQKPPYAVRYTAPELPGDGPVPWVGTDDVMLSGSVSPSAAVVGDIVTWTYEIYNAQEDLWTYDLSFLADVPDTLEILSVTTTSGAERDPRDGQEVWVDIPSMAPGEGVRITIETRLLEGSLAEVLDAMYARAMPSGGKGVSKAALQANEVCVTGAVADLTVTPCTSVYPGELPVTGNPNPALWMVPVAALAAGLGGWALMSRRRAAAV